MLLERLRAGDAFASDEVFQRYFTKLTAMTRSRLSKRLSARLDADDVVLSAYRSFFVRAREGAFLLAEGSDLWRLLLEITLHKLYRQVEHHTAQRRSVSREVKDQSGAPALARSPDAAPEATVLLAEELDFIRSSLSDEVRRAFELRLEGLEIGEIAIEAKKSERTVRRWLEQAKELLIQRFPEATAIAPKPLASRPNRPKPLRLEAILPDELLDFSDYKLLRQISSGGSGKVYQALVSPGDRLLAVKFMKRALIKRRDVTERFIAEARIVAGLKHPGIIRIHGLGRTPNRGFFLAMDYHARGDLQTHLRPSGLPGCDQALRWTLQAAKAVAHAHDQGILHCDLKPSNLLVSNDGSVVVSDFGLARSDWLSDQDSLAGTPAFLAPEQLEPHWGTIGAATDVYGLGTVLYSLLVGRAPRMGTVGDILSDVGSGQPVQVPAELPRPLAILLERSLAPRPADRFASAHQFAQRIEQTIHSLSVSPENPDPPAARARTPRSRS